jgi:crotonobetainyl-CoA:carnitine CoA-transferase CaiB-like acyl-CoA transferase
LNGLRVLDLADERGILCGKILGDLGADVVQIEPPAGSSARQVGPFDDAGASLFWAAYARNKRSVVLDLAADGGRARLAELARQADFLIESGAWAVPAALALEELASANPRLITVSITPFGRSGPKAAWAGSDLVVAASAGVVLLQGDDDRPPVRVTSPQAFLHAGAEAAVAALVAHAERRRSGRGQHVDVSAQIAHAAATQGEILTAIVRDQPSARVGGGLRLAGNVRIRFTYPAKDGHVSITHAFGAAMGPATQRLMAWLAEIGECEPELASKDWISFGARLLRGEETPEVLTRAQERIAAATAKRTKQELTEIAMTKRLLLAPSCTPADLLASEQLAARGFLERSGALTLPGRFAVLSRTPIEAARPAPRVGEHDGEIARSWSTPRAHAPAPGPAGAAPLAGLRVLDFSWAIAGPTVGRTFADYGATVVKIESASHPDACRTVRPFLGGRFGSERSALFHTMNAGKLQLGLDLAVPASRDVILDLARWADLVVESFSPGVMQRLGFDYASLARVNPRVVMLSTSLLGQTGPLSRLAGYGNLGAALAGFLELTGWPDRAPSGPFAAYTDYISPRFAASAVLAALDHRERTGEGQHIDISQVESSIHFLAAYVGETSATGRVTTRSGNADPAFQLHGVFPAAGEDRWVAIAARGDAEVRALARVLGCEPEALDERALAAATRPFAADELAAKLQAAGVPAHAVASSADLARDAQLLARDHFVAVEHPGAGPSTIEASRFMLSRTPAARPTAAPALGGDNERVLRELLGYDDERIGALALAGALQ